MGNNKVAETAPQMAAERTKIVFENARLLAWFVETQSTSASTGWDAAAQLLCEVDLLELENARLRQECRELRAIQARVVG